MADKMIPLSVIEDVVANYVADPTIRSNFLKALVNRASHATATTVQPSPVEQKGNSTKEETAPIKGTPILERFLPISMPPLNNFQIPVRISRLSETAKLPTYGSEGAAAMDLYSDEDITILPFGGTSMVKTNLVIEVPHGYKAEIYSRSGIANKGVIISNSPGKIDEDYRGEIKILMFNLGKDPFHIGRGDRIAQMEINPVYKIALLDVPFDELTYTKRGSGGFGSTGMK